MSEMISGDKYHNITTSYTTDQAGDNHETTGQQTSTTKGLLDTRRI